MVGSPNVAAGLTLHAPNSSQKGDARLEVSPCTAACPIHTDAQEYVSLIAQGRFADALSVVRETNPLPRTLGWVCAHPCETKCRRGQVDRPIAICALKRFAAERGEGAPGPVPVENRLDKKVAIVGSGPSGLTAASDLALMGYQVTVFDKNPEVGGALRYGIPVYRLPRKELDKDMAGIAQLGVKFETGIEVGKDVTLEGLKSRGFDAVLLGVGLSVSRGLPIPGADLPGVLLALPFLRDTAAGKRCFEPGKTVIVVGGGNVAFDVARSAVRMGAGKVRMACLEARHEMPAWPWEIEEGEEEKIELNPAWGPKAILSENGKITGLQVVAVKAVFDAEGRFNPTFYDDRLKTVDGDTVILSIGQAADLGFVKGSGVELNPRGQLVVNRSTMATTAEGVFASGEVMTGPGAAVDAMASGRRAAKGIHRYLSTGHVGMLESDDMKTVGDLEPGTLSKIKQLPRVSMPVVAPEERIRNFDPVELGYDEQMAIKEAQRCLLCAVGAQRRVAICPDCLTCLRVCPFGVPVVSGRGVMIRLDQCQSCGICATRCPRQIIGLKHFSQEEIMDIVRSRLKAASDEGADPTMLGFVCRYQTASLSPNGQLGDALSPKGIKIIELPCTGRVDVSHILTAFELGADGVFVTGCADDGCHFREGTKYSRGVVDQARKILKDVGLGAERVEMVMLTSHEADEVMTLAEGVRERIQALGRTPVRV
ncbi:MAG: hydrogenase iron-sulfur subunit [Chloroflexi bacterium]|nr:hydrogenase iron-sulfur subunit [Chloroflexota bacterium]